MRKLLMLSLFPALACSTMQAAADAAAASAASGAVSSSMSPSGNVATASDVRSRSRAPGEDEHHLVAEDWFIGESPYQSGWMYVRLAKQLTSPSEGTKGEGEFMNIDGSKIWTKYYYRTRPAAKDDIKLGVVVIVPEKSDEGVYVPPVDRDESRQIGWFMGTVTDLTDMFKNEVAVGEYKVRPEALRVIVQ